VVYDPDKQDRAEIVVANTGRGELRGTASSPQSWVKVARQFKCAPGQTKSLPLDIDVTSLEPGKTHLAEVKVAAASAGAAAPSSTATVRVEVRVPAPLLDVTPMQVELGATSRRRMFTPPATFKVRNMGKSRAVCRITTRVPWLVLDPTQFTCLPGGTQTIELTGRTDLLPPDQAHETTLQLDVQGGYSRQVQVSLRTRQLGRQVASVLLIGFALSALLGAIIWFIVTVLPLLAL
jgi:hypothetical protein